MDASGSKSSKAPSAPSAQSQTQTSPQAPQGTPSGHPPADQAAKPAAKKAPAGPIKRVDLNNASLAELMTLVSEPYAKKIIAHRPYKSKGELVTKAGLPEGVYHAVKHKVEMQTPRKPAPKK